ncbi:hypothetical protein [Citricoccus sp. NR2]|uniref:hypothetical protein n=1 Tax=Citricoccus sp. NR2 TaxID=3004095 RepID=UPI0022DE556D|nr:hypothetical protein [Citricoccus sp. NR2]WBL17840.1 hypothetical protein O1A05_08440 [Citricoccus sp. NR2]
MDGEISAQEWLTWLRELPSHVPHVSRIAVMRAWSPEDDVIAPTRARGIRIDELSEDVLRDIRDDNLLTINYPRTAQDSQQGRKRSHVKTELHRIPVHTNLYRCQPYQVFRTLSPGELLTSSASSCHIDTMGDKVPRGLLHV